MRRFLWAWLCAGGLLTASIVLALPANTLTITEYQGLHVIAHPLQFGRVFRQGEIPRSPEVLLDGQPLPSQADVKLRWPDGSVKHAVLAVIVPSLEAQQTRTLSFRDRAFVQSTPPSKAEMLANFDFQAVMQMSCKSPGGWGELATEVRARDFLQAWDGTSDSFTGPVWYWTKGEIATTLILADHSTARSFDVGSLGGSDRPIRPLFHVTFWPGLGKVEVRFIGEIAQPDNLRDQEYTLRLFTGLAEPALAYEYPTARNGGYFHHRAGSRWTRQAWIGGAPTKVRLNHHLAYLASTTLFPNFDTSLTLNRAYLDGEYGLLQQWQQSSREPGDSGLWSRYMPQPGGRPDIGLWPSWTVLWLYDADPLCEELALGHADLSAGFPMHFRETQTAREFLEGQSPGLGRPISPHGRPVLYLGRDNLFVTWGLAEDRLSYWPPESYQPQGADPNRWWRTTFRLGYDAAINANIWTPDCAHLPDPASAQYLLTGDYFYLEQLYFWSSWAAFNAHPGDPYTQGFNSIFYARGPSGKYGGLFDEIRGDAWALRLRAMTAVCAPDDSPEKALFTRLTDEALAIWEGVWGIAGHYELSHPALWTWGRDVGSERFSRLYDKTLPYLAAPGLGFWNPAASQTISIVDGIDPAQASLASAPWMQNFLILALGRTAELGFPAQKLRDLAARALHGQLTDLQYDPRLCAAYRVPMMNATFPFRYFSNWAEVRAAYLPDFDPALLWAQQTVDGEHDYAFIAYAAAAYSQEAPLGPAAWKWMATARQNTSSFGTAFQRLPKWAFLPRTSAVEDVQAPQAAGAITVDELGSSRAVLSWTAGTDDLAVAGYSFELATDSSFQTILPAFRDIFTAEPSIRLSGLEGSRTYHARVRTLDRAAHSSDYTPTATFTTLADPTLAITYPEEGVMIDVEGHPVVQYGASVGTPLVSGIAGGLANGYQYVENDTDGQLVLNFLPAGPHSLKLMLLDADGQPMPGTLQTRNFFLDQLNQWRRRHLLPLDGSQDLANPAGEGVVNLMKFACNIGEYYPDLLSRWEYPLHPEGIRGLPVFTYDEQHVLHIRFLRRKPSSRPRIVYTLESSGDGIDWTPLPSAWETTVSLNDIWERVFVTDPSAAPSDGQARIVRLRIATTE